ncbi:hypothetical protein BN938_1053 [Mucinivorans hirudinis]|uniref:Outer membrane protein beta-barrel domain-containing protein n=1 Tax=Mucinivorans hirudinis TaxID=1433126 RepID=A0A060R7F1_9BACT|nr:hypothetical protein BN938_1053 [Mucinivorans hirudinis]
MTLPLWGQEEFSTLQAEWKPVLTNHYFGLRGGYGIGKERFEPLRLSEGYKGLLNLGLIYRFDAPSQKYVGCVEIDLNYAQKGFAYETYIESNRIYSRKYTLIELPILWQPYLPLSEKNGMSRLYLSIGPYLGYSLSSDYRIYEKSTGATIEEGVYEYNTIRDNRLECGLILGGGLQFGILRNLNFGIEFRYQIMLSNVLKGKNKVQDNPFFSPVDNMSLSAGLSYKIFTGKGKKDLESQK